MIHLAKHLPVVIILLGPPGVGKGTQATHLSKELNIPHISTGDIFRDNIKRKTPLGLTTQKIIEEGLFVPDEIVDAIVFDRLQAQDCKQGCILDGYPRTSHQAIALEKFIGSNFQLRVINYVLEDTLIMERLTGRLTCSQCGRPFHRLFNPPKQELICDACGHQLLQRKDDTEAVVRTRLETYHKQTAPLIEFYEKKKQLDTVQCKGSIEEILNTSIDLLKQERKS